MRPERSWCNRCRSHSVGWVLVDEPRYLATLADKDRDRKSGNANSAYPCPACNSTRYENWRGGKNWAA